MSFKLLFLVVLLSLLTGFIFIGSGRPDGRLSVVRYGLGLPFAVHQKQTPEALAFYQGVGDWAKFIPRPAPIISGVCDYINNQLPQRGWNQCYLNLGTSLSYQATITRDVVDDLTNLCQRVQSSEITGGDCVSGIYTGINLAYFEGRQNPDPKDHFQLCHYAINGDYRLRCYRGLVHSLYRLSNRDPVAAAAKIDAVEPADLRFEVWLTFFSSLIYENFNSKQAVEVCQQFDGEKRMACIQGYATGIVEVAANGQEGEQIVAFCLEAGLTESEQGQCLSRGFSDLASTYPGQGEKLCLASAPTEFASFCQFAPPLRLN